MAEAVVAARPGVGAIDRSWGRGDGPAKLARSARAKYVPRSAYGKAPCLRRMWYFGPLKANDPPPF